MSEITITVRPFRMGTDKEAALKPIEEAAELFGAYQIWYPDAKDIHCADSDCAECEHNEYCDSFVHASIVENEKLRLADEIADCIQAACNLADRYGIDLPAAMSRCEERNRMRGRYERETQVEEDNDGLADVVHDSGERVGVRVDDCEGDSGIIAEYHRMLRRMLGDVKGVHDKLVAQAESHAKLKHECRMYRAMLNDAAKEYKFVAGCCDLNANNCVHAQASNWTLLGWRDALLELLKDAAKDFSEQRAEYEHAMTGYRERAAALEESERRRHELEQERDAYKQNYHDIIHGNEINAEWFDRRGFVELPKGKDGRHIRMGETVRWGDIGSPFEVHEICYYPNGEVRVSDDGSIDVSACHCNHVDDVLDPIASTIIDNYDAGKLTRDELVAALRDMS